MRARVDSQCTLGVPGILPSSLMNTSGELSTTATGEDEFSDFVDWSIAGPPANTTEMPPYNQPGSICRTEKEWRQWHDADALRNDPELAIMRAVEIFVAIFGPKKARQVWKKVLKRARIPAWHVPSAQNQVYRDNEVRNIFIGSGRNGKETLHSKSDNQNLINKNNDSLDGWIRKPTGTSARMSPHPHIQPGQQNARITFSLQGACGTEQQPTTASEHQNARVLASVDGADEREQATAHPGQPTAETGLVSQNTSDEKQTDTALEIHLARQNARDLTRRCAAARRLARTRTPRNTPGLSAAVHKSTIRLANHLAYFAYISRKRVLELESAAEGAGEKLAAAEDAGTATEPTTTPEAASPDSYNQPSGVWTTAMSPFAPRSEKDDKDVRQDSKTVQDGSLITQTHTPPK